MRPVTCTGVLLLLAAAAVAVAAAAATAACCCCCLLLLIAPPPPQLWRCDVGAADAAAAVGGHGPVPAAGTRTQTFHLAFAVLLLAPLPPNVNVCVQGLVGFKNQRLPLPAAPPPDCPPMFLQIIREVGV